jgi:hypothetical protein
MPKHKSLTVSARIVIAGRKRKCYFSKAHFLEKGDVCLEVRDGMSWKGYCAACGVAMVDAGHKTLAAFEGKLHN